jgi:hypothetical protein
MKTIITGTGRCGSTYFMKLLTDLGFDTGWDNTEKAHNYEWHIRGNKSKLGHQPRIIKDGDLCNDLLERIRTWNWEVEHVYIILRDYNDVANHKFYNRHDDEAGHARKEAWMNIYKTHTAARVGSLMWQLVDTDIPYSFLVFPRTVTDPEYLYNNCALLQEVPYSVFKASFDRIADVSKVHWGLS